MGFGRVKKQPCQGKNHQTKAGEEGNILEDTCGAGFLPRGMQWLRRRRKEISQILVAVRVLAKVQV